MKCSTIILFAVNALGLVSAAAVADPEPASIVNPDDLVNNLETRRCFLSGEKFDDMPKTYQKVRDLCAGPFKGTYKKNEVRTYCRAVGRISVKYTIGLQGHNAGSTRNMDFNECVNGLDKEIKNCAKGGDTTYGNWRYRVDPNSGSC
ncbi:unnamed protein product [Clonostachys byssicola]|uniref:Secreted protein n=1 Tax=Clonostachys byssicola TaxID=160290 RepID=A0A9N9UVP6_9HYPO|nr:unnamed protein product [Clonostachys byssicola]